MPQGMIRKDDCILLVLDIQGTLFTTMVEKERMLAASLKMIDFARRVDIPIVATEQYPKGLGPSLPEILEALPEDIEVIPKTSFSCFGEPKFDAKVRSLNRKTIIVVGMETHICVNQTTLEGLEKGYNMYLVADAISSYTEFDTQIAFERLRAAGATIATSEMAMFEILRVAKTGSFKKCFDLLKR
jgi:nicotinamidase-related amidase